MKTFLQTALRALYPPECLLCRDPVATEFGLCGTCWAQTPFQGGAMCDICGASQVGVAEDGIICDACDNNERLWDHGRAALAYSGNGRKLVLALKHGDRQDVVTPAARWMARAAAPILKDHTIVVPVPLHWRRMAKRRYNQSALLAQALAKVIKRPYLPDLLERTSHTESLDGKDAIARKDALNGAIQINPRHRHRIAGGRPVLLVDDVLTTGATLNACAKVLKSSRAGEVSVIVLARAAKAP